MTGHCAVNDDCDRDLTGTVSAVACATVDALQTITTFGACRTDNLARGERLIGRANGERAPSSCARLVAITRTVGARHDKRREVNGERRAPLVSVSSVTGAF